MLLSMRPRGVAGAAQKTTQSQPAPSSTVEQYIKTIYLQSAAQSIEILPMGNLVQAMEVAHSTATAMVKVLDKEKLVQYRPRIGVSLTASGERLALLVLRRHRLVETFLQTILGYDWSEVHNDAERLEHAVSSTFIDRLDAFLGYPSFDPHGAPIPTTGGSLPQRTLIPLHSCQTGDIIRIARINSKDSSFLQSLKRYQLTPGRRCTVVENNPHLSTIAIKQEEQSSPISLGYQSAEPILVQKEGSRLG